MKPSIRKQDGRWLAAARSSRLASSGHYPPGGPMIDWLYRWIYRREIRERQEHMAAQADVWRRRQVENDARWERDTARLHAFRDELRAATSWDEVKTVLARMEET